MLGWGVGEAPLGKMLGRGSRKQTMEDNVAFQKDSLHGRKALCKDVQPQCTK